MRTIMATLAVLAVACGGGESSGGSQDAQQPAMSETQPAAQPAAQGTVHEVRMELTAEGQYEYNPSTLTIKPGDTVRWINVSGGPHNVSFYADQIPSGAADVLNAAMANRMGNLSGQLLVAPNATYEVSFAGAPAGEYHYFCTPHEALGMKATLTVQP